MLVTESCSDDKVLELVKEMTRKWGIFSTRDWVLTHIPPSLLQAIAMSTIVNQVEILPV